MIVKIVLAFDFLFVVDDGHYLVHLNNRSHFKIVVLGMLKIIDIFTLNFSSKQGFNDNAIRKC